MHSGAACLPCDITAQTKAKGNFKGFRVTKNGSNTGVFERIIIEGNNEENNGNNNQNNNQWDNSAQNNNHTIRINVNRRGENNENNIDLDN